MSEYAPSAALLNTPLMRKKHDPAVLEAIMSGEFHTKRATQYQPNRPMRRFLGRFSRPRPQRSPDREKSIQRRRMLAATWPMPPVMAGMLTTSQVAYARIVADEIAAHGQCNRTLDEIAARGGMCRKTAKRAQDRLAELGWINVKERPVEGRKHLSNVITIVSAEWVTWIKMGPKPRSIGGHSCPTMGNQSYPKAPSGRVDGSQGAYEKKRGAKTEPPDWRQCG